MILIDFSAIAIGNIVTMKLEPDESLVRQMILKSIKMYRNKYHQKYGEIVLCLDHGGSWRKEIFPQYKAKRGTHRAENPEYWAEVWRIINKVATEIKENFPYKFVQVWKCEGDDIIAILCSMTQEFGAGEDVMIISADNDFCQLQKWSNINQFSTITKKLIKEYDPHKFLFEHICRGDGGDGVPNILSPDNSFVDGIRQHSLTKKRIDLWYQSFGRDDQKLQMGEDIYRNFQRNQHMIDLSMIPTELKEQIINTYTASIPPPKSKVMSYLVKNRCRELLETIGDFL